MSRQVDEFAHRMFHNRTEGVREVAFRAEKAVDSLCLLVNFFHEKAAYPADYQEQLALINQAIADFRTAKAHYVTQPRPCGLTERAQMTPTQEVAQAASQALRLADQIMEALCNQLGRRGINPDQQTINQLGEFHRLNVHFEQTARRHGG